MLKPEKWDSVTRFWREHVFLLGKIDLLLLDEIHHLGDDRGATLEAVVVRMRFMNQCAIELKAENRPHSSIYEGCVALVLVFGLCYSFTNINNSLLFFCRLRIIALSATLPNLTDIGDWLHCTPDAVHYFDETFRPVPLTVHTLAFGSFHNAFLFERSLDAKVGDIISRYSCGRSSLVFCSSKKSAENVALLLSNKKGFKPHMNGEVIQNSLLKNALCRGVGFHHSGLSPDDRSAVERLFLAGHLSVLCSTATLAYGVNLPAFLVIIKGTNCWRGGTRGYERMSRSGLKLKARCVSNKNQVLSLQANSASGRGNPLMHACNIHAVHTLFRNDLESGTLLCLVVDIIQMIGRAGRAGFDTAGVAVVMTSDEDRTFFGELSLHAEVVESNLLQLITEG
jgi:replicative superfamily II helicase